MKKKPNYLSTFVYGFIGTAVSACLAAVAISIVASATVLTGGAALAACAFLGASLGALVATEGMVESDLRTGNNRNPIEFVTGLTGGVFIGFAAGAAVYGVIAAAPALAAGVGQKAVMFLGETGFTTKVVPEIIKASAGVIAAAETTFSINDAYTCGSGYNPLLDVVFDDNVEAYETIEFCVDMLALGYVQAAETYGKTPSDQGVYIENENNLHDYDDGQLDDIIDMQTQENNKTVFKYKHDPLQNPKVLKDAIEDPNAVYGFRPKKDGSLAQFADQNWEDPIAVEGYRQDRIAYHKGNPAMDACTGLYDEYFDTY